MMIKCRMTSNGKRWEKEFDASTKLSDVILELRGGECPKENPIYPLICRLGTVLIDGSYLKGVPKDITLQDLTVGYRPSDVLCLCLMFKMGGDRYSVDGDGVFHYECWGADAYIDYAGYQDTNGKWYLRRQYVDTWHHIESEPVYYYDENEIKRELGLGYSSTPGPEGYRYFATFGEDGRVASSRAELII